MSGYRNFSPDQIVKSCPKLESGLRFGPEGVRACQLGPFAAPLYWTDDEAKSLHVTHDMIIEKRRELFNKLNDNESDVICKKCAMVVQKPFAKVDFSKIGRIDHAPRTICNLRCDFCGFTHAEKSGDVKNSFVEANYESLKFMQCFGENDVEWDAAVDFNGGETSLLKNLGSYLDYFREMKIRVLCFTNSVQFSQHIYDGVADGSIQWLVTSIDAGTPSTYKVTKKGDVFGKVLENCARYAEAGSKGGGKFAVKYIFTENNCSDDDIYGFAYAMLAIRPQKIWLTYDFTPFGIISPDASDFQGYDFTKQINAYAKLYHLLKKHGLEAIHYTEGHLAKISRPGKLLLQKTLERCQQLEPRSVDAEKQRTLHLNDFRMVHDAPTALVESFSLSDGRIVASGENLDLSNKRVAIVPATEATRSLLKIVKACGPASINFVDASTLLQGKKVDGHEIMPYEGLPDLKPDVVLALPPDQHRAAILAQLERSMGGTAGIFVFSGGGNDGFSL